MEPDSFTSLLQKFADALRCWADWLPGDRDAAEDECPADAEFQFHELADDELLSVLARLGAEQRGYLAELIDTAVNLVIKAGEEFVAACDGATPPSGVQFWQDVALDDIPVSDPAYPDEFGKAVAGLLEAIYRCDKVFAAIDTATRQTDSPNSDEEPFVPSSYSPARLYNRLDITDATLNKYAKDAGIKTPGQGQRDFRYCRADCIILLRHIIENVSGNDTVENARQMLLEIEKKSKDQK